jgi:acyl-CoA thioester hydrolase
VSLPVVEAHCEYRRPARYDDEIEVRTEGRMVSAVRMKFSYTVVRCADQVVAADGYTLHAAVGPSGRPCRLPERIRQVFA